MDVKPELIIFNQHKIGGVQSFYYNLIKHSPDSFFDIKWVFINKPEDTDPKPLQAFETGNEHIIDLDQNEDYYSIALKLKPFISSKKKGIVLTNFDEELITIHLYRKRNKTIIFLCHDEYYVHRAIRYAFLIDRFIAHNRTYFDILVKELPNRLKDIFFIPYGVAIPNSKKKDNLNQPLRIVIAARLQLAKGVYDLPEIDKYLKQKSILVNWTIIGDGPEKEKLVEITRNFKNFEFLTLPNNQAVLNELVKNDVFILPSRLEGLPVSLLEAMSTGCVPIIAAFNEGIKEVVTEDIGFVLPVGDIEKFGNAIEILHLDRLQLEKKSKAAIHKIKTEYEVKNRTNEYFKLFKESIGYKTKYKYKFPNYGGHLNNPWIPKGIRWIVKRLK